MNNGIGVAKFLTVPISSAKRGNVALYEHFEHKVTDMYEDIMTVLLCGRGDRWCQGGGGITSGDSESLLVFNLIGEKQKSAEQDRMRKKK